MARGLDPQVSVAAGGDAEADQELDGWCNQVDGVRLDQLHQLAGGTMKRLLRRSGRTNRSCVAPAALCQFKLAHAAVREREFVT